MEKKQVMINGKRFNLVSMDGKEPHIDKMNVDNFEITQPMIFEYPTRKKLPAQPMVFTAKKKPQTAVEQLDQAVKEHAAKYGMSYASALEDVKRQRPDLYAAWVHKR